MIYKISVYYQSTSIMSVEAYLNIRVRRQDLQPWRLYIRRDLYLHTERALKSVEISEIKDFLGKNAERVEITIMEGMNAEER